jgi:hypothetical protein
VKEFLSRAGVAFVARNVDEDDTAYDELVARGLRTGPGTIAGDLIVTGYDPAALDEVIAAERRSDRR